VVGDDAEVRLDRSPPNPEFIEPLSKPVCRKFSGRIEHRALVLRIDLGIRSREQFPQVTDEQVGVLTARSGNLPQERAECCGGPFDTRSVLCLERGDNVVERGLNCSTLFGREWLSTYLARLLLYVADWRAMEWTLAGEPPVTDESLREDARAFAEWLLVPEYEAELVAFLAGDAKRLPRAVERAFDRLRASFERSVEAASEGRLSPELAEHLTRVTRLANGGVDVPDLAAFAAWCLEQMLPVEAVGRCDICGYVWLKGRADGRFCQRPAPGRQTTCRGVASVEKYGREHADFKKQRRRLYERCLFIHI
jgi:hypothetical protein